MSEPVDAPRPSAADRPREAPSAGRRERYGLLLAAILAAFALQGIANPAPWEQVVVTTLVDAGSRRVRVVVEDNGSGIALEHLSQVFVPFFTTKGDRHGTGLGLSIVKSILEAHEGGISVESEPGRGARFVLELPVWSR